MLKFIFTFVFFLNFSYVFFSATLPLNLKLHADSTPHSIIKSHYLLSKYLIRPTKNNEEKVLIFSYWIAKNIKYNKKEIIKFGRNKSGKELLQNRKGICGCISNLFQLLCDDSSVKCYTITGRSYGNFISRYFTYFHLKHAWNAVFINNEWRLVDATWNQHVNTKEFKKWRELKWVFMNPEEFSKTHYPYNPAWQLLLNPLTKKEFFNKLTPTRKDYQYNDSLADMLDTSKTLTSLKSFNLTYNFDKNARIFRKNLSYLGYTSVFNAKDSIEVEDGLTVLKKLNSTLYYKGFILRRNYYLRLIKWTKHYEFIHLNRDK